MVFAPATGFTISEFCFALPTFISWLVGGITVGFVCPQLEKMHSGKATPLTCSGGQTGLWFSYRHHIEAFGATVPLPPHIKSSSNPHHPMGGATCHHMHCRYPLCLCHRMAFHKCPCFRFFHCSPIFSYVLVSVCWIGACIPFGFGLLPSMFLMSLTKRERTLHFDTSRITHNWQSAIIDVFGLAHSCTSGNVAHLHPLVTKLLSMAASALIQLLPQFATSTQMCSKWPSRHQQNYEWPCQQRQVIQLCGTLEPLYLSAMMQQTSKEP